MSTKFKLTEDQETYITKNMGTDDLSAVSIIFEVDSRETSGITEEYTNKSTRLSMKICRCPDGSLDWTCCRP